MNSTKIILVAVVLLFHCAAGQIKNNRYNENISKLIFDNYDLKSKFITMFKLNNEGMKVFKVLISRRNQFVRVSIFQIINKDELNELPSSYFTFRTDTFVCYDGSEVISNIRLDKGFVDKLKSRLSSNVINDSRVFQFDLNSDKKVELHIPAINPYDLIETAPKHFHK